MAWQGKGTKFPFLGIKRPVMRDFSHTTSTMPVVPPGDSAQEMMAHMESVRTRINDSRVALIREVVDSLASDSDDKDKILASITVHTTVFVPEQMAYLSRLFPFVRTSPFVKEGQFLIMNEPLPDPLNLLSQPTTSTS